MAFDPITGDIYVSYLDRTMADKFVVRKWDGSSWVTVGSNDASTGTTQHARLALTSNGIPYVAYVDLDNSARLTVMKLDGSNWVPVGDVGFALGGRANRLGFVIDPSSGVPYVAYSDAVLSDKATVRHFVLPSSWPSVGAEGFSAGTTHNLMLAIGSTGVPYVVYEDAAAGGKTTVMKFASGTWANVGTAGFSAGAAVDQSLLISARNTLYTAYIDRSVGNKVVAKRFDGSTADWVTEGPEGFSAGGAAYLTGAMSPSGTPYVVFKDSTQGNKLTVMKLD